MWNNIEGSNGVWFMERIECNALWVVLCGIIWKGVMECGLWKEK